MFEREIKFIYDFNKNKIRNLGPYFTFQELTTVDIHPAILKYISAEIDYLIFEDRQKLLKDSIFDYSGEKIIQHFQDIGKEIKRTKRFSNEYISKLMLHSISFTLNFITKPNWTLSKFIFDVGDHKTVPEIIQILSYLYYHEHLKHLLISYFKKKNILSINKDELKELLGSVDRISSETFLPDLLNNMLKAIADFFSIGSTNKNLVQISAIEMYLVEKGLGEHQNKIKQYSVDNDKSTINISDAEILFKDVGYVQNEVVELPENDEENIFEEDVVEENEKDDNEEKIDREIIILDENKVEENLEEEFSDEDNDLDDLKGNPEIEEPEVDSIEDEESFDEKDDFEVREINLENDENEVEEKQSSSGILDNTMMVNELGEIHKVELTEEQIENEKSPDLSDDKMDSEIEDETSNKNDADENNDEESENDFTNLISEEEILRSEDHDENDESAESNDEIVETLDLNENSNSGDDDFEYEEDIDFVEESDDLVEEDDESEGMNGVIEEATMELEESADQNVDESEIEKEEKPKLDIFELIDKYKMERVVKNVFDFDMDDFSVVVEKILSCDSAENSIEMMEDTLANRGIKVKSKEAKIFRKMIIAIYNEKN